MTTREQAVLDAAHRYALARHGREIGPDGSTVYIPIADQRPAERSAKAGLLHAAQELER